jgi:SAM-dependent methyltransferase
MSLVETSYGNAKRLAFCAGVIAERVPQLVLDVGCGTGTTLTRPLAERFPATRFIGIDSDPATIDHARQANALSNLVYVVDDELDRHPPADLIIASEVVEHVENPEEFLATLRARLTPSGWMIITLPNGRGPFEWMSLVEVLLRLSGLFHALRGAKRLLTGYPEEHDTETKDTLAVSPHINFFSYGQVQALFARAGLVVARAKARTFLCGFGFDHVVRSPRAVAWNSEIADQLPPWCVSAWMFLLEPREPRPAPPFRRGAFSRWRRRLNEAYWVKG